VTAGLQELLDREAIRQLKARYFALLHAQDWDGFRALFTDDVHAEEEGLPAIDGGDAFVDLVRELLDGTGTWATLHGHMPEITIDGPADAHGSWMLDAYVEWPSDPETGERRGLEGYGRYDETYRKIDGEWRISSLRVTYQRVDPLLPTPLPEEILAPAEAAR
jgi:SnoaL-like protein